VLLPKIATGEGAVEVAKKLQAVLEEPFPLEELTLDVEASIGLAVYPDHGGDPDELLQHADIAMYVAKESHVGFVLFDPSLDQYSPPRLALLGELRRAMEHKQLLLHYQPKVDAHSGQVLGVEALVRWEIPARLLVVEITESTIMADPAHALEVLSRLNKMGVPVSIDDFGTGYSSMAYLKNLPVQELKVDRSFVGHMISSSRDAQLAVPFLRPCSGRSPPRPDRPWGWAGPRLAC
jgi:predicted signal transduction protein with EAL and GGDEF domain